MTRFRVLYLIVTVILLFALPGCGSGAPAPSASPSAPPPSAAPSGGAGTTAAADDLSQPIELTVARFDIPSDAGSSDLFTQEGGKYYDARWAELAKKFNVTVAYRAYDYATRDDALRQMLSSGDAPDAMLSTLGAAACGEYLAQGLIRALPEGFEEEYANVKASLGMVLRREAYRAGGAYFALPRALEGAEPYTDTTLGIYYRKDLAARSGVAVKGGYTLDELYAMFERVQADNPNIVMYGHVQPSRILELGLAGAVPEIARNDGFYPDGGKYAYAYRKPEIAGGMRAFKKFYDAAFLDRRFFERPIYEARARFAGGELFSYSDTLDIPTLDRAMSDLKAADPAAPADAVGFAWILDGGGNFVAQETGNSWSEWIFGAKAEDRAVSRFLALYDYLLGPEGLATAVPGASGLATPLVAGALEDSRVCALDPGYSDAAKRAAGDCWSLRKSAQNLAVLKFDAALDSFGSDIRDKAAALKPAGVIARLVCETGAGGLDAAWQAWLGENGGAIDGILNELNKNPA